MLRVVASSCKLFCSARERTQEASHDDFTSQVVSAVSEVFNNIAIHGYAERTSGNVEIEIEMDDDGIVLRLSDTGQSFDLGAVPAPRLDELPESRMGLYIVRSFMDEVSYVPANGSGAPNVLTLSKRY